MCNKISIWLIKCQMTNLTTWLTWWGQIQNWCEHNMKTYTEQNSQTNSLIRWWLIWHQILSDKGQWWHNKIQKCYVKLESFKKSKSSRNKIIKAVNFKLSHNKIPHKCNNKQLTRLSHRWEQVECRICRIWQKWWIILWWKKWWIIQKWWKWLSRWWAAWEATLVLCQMPQKCKIWWRILQCQKC